MAWQIPMNGPAERRRAYIALFLILVVAAAANNWSQIFERQETDFVVQEAGIPETCYSTQTVLRFGNARSSPPTQSNSGWCGVILTDHGPFQIIEDGMIILGSQSRSELVHMLRPGCHYHAKYVGFGTAPPMIFHATQTPPCL